MLCPCLQPHYVQDKVYVGIAKPPSGFNLKERLEGANGSFLSHIATQTGAKTFLRGQGSGYIEPTSKKESFEALHIYISHSNKNGLDSARQLCESLIEKVRGDLENFQASQQSQQPLGFGGTPGYGGKQKRTFYNGVFFFFFRHCYVEFLAWRFAKG